MRPILSTVAALLLLAGCASNPRPVGAPVQPVAEPRQSGSLLGVTAAELATRFGAPSLQVREGAGTKLQYRGERCILDAYLYSPPSAAGVARVTHVDTRDREGRTVPVAGCMAMLESR